MTVEHRDDPGKSRIKGWVYVPDSDQERLLVNAAYQALIRAYTDILEHAQFFEDKDKSWVVGPFVNEETAVIFEAQTKKFAAQVASSVPVHHPRSRYIERHQDWHRKNIRRK
jgi:hypothetical protein